MNKDIAKNICTQMVEDVEGLCECPRYNEKDKTCIGCKELAIKTILEENKKLKEKIDKIIEYLDNLSFDGYGDDLSPKHIVDILKGDNDEIYKN